MSAPQFKEDLAAHIWFRDGGVHHEGAEYDHLKRFRKRLNGVMSLKAPRSILMLLELLGLEASVPEHKEKLTTGELLNPAETHSVPTVCGRFALLHARQQTHSMRCQVWSRCAGEADSRIGDCSETRDSSLEGNETLSTNLSWTVMSTNTWRDWMGFQTVTGMVRQTGSHNRVACLLSRNSAFVHFLISVSLQGLFFFSDCVSSFPGMLASGT